MADCLGNAVPVGAAVAELVVQVEEAGELLGARFAYVAAVGASLLVCEEAYGQRSAQGKCVS